MTKPKIPKKIPKERPEKINPGIPAIPKKEPDYVPEEPGVPKPEKPEEVPAYMPYNISQGYALHTLNYMPCRRYRQQVCYAINGK